MSRTARISAWLAVVGAGAMGLVSACGIDPSLTCGATCADATTTADGGTDAQPLGDATTEASTPDASKDVVVADVSEASPPSDGSAGGLDANCHAPDSSTPQWACPQSGCCPFGGNGYSCNSQGYCCRQNGSSCSSSTSCCGVCVQGSGGNGSCALQCASTGQSCTQTSDCCINSWCNGNTNKCTTCTAHNMPCTSNYECCSGDACQGTNDGGKTCQGN